MTEKLVFKIFPVRLSYINMYYYRYAHKRSKWFSILAVVEDETLLGKHYFPIKTFTMHTNIKMLEGKA